MKRLLGIAASVILLIAAGPAAAAAPPTPLFASDAPIRFTLSGPINDVASGRAESREAVLTLQSQTPETHAVRVSPRGITRLQRDVCQFAPLRVQFVQPPAANSLFHGQRRMKLVTHCRSSENFQQFLLLEYAAYRLYNLLSPASYRARLAHIDYVDERGRPIISRLGFLIEDIDDVAQRNGTREASVGTRINRSALDPREAARFALFEYMIGNLDWAMTAGPEGEGCCHNSRLIGPVGGGLVPVPYDFDFSGLVDAPYSEPPDIVPVRSVRNRYYRGYCQHNALIPAVANDFRSRQSQLLGVFSQIPQMDERTRGRATAYLGQFFADIADQRTIERQLLRTCLK